MHRSTRSVLCLTILSTLALTALSPATSQADAKEPTRILLVLDASGSMNGKDPSGLTKIQAAQQALSAAVAGLPEDAEVGLRVYGATYPGKDKAKSCVDTQLVHPIVALDRPGLTAAINSFQAVGDTPIAYSLEQAIGDLGPDGNRHIILVSDGEENCVPDPCPVVDKLMAAEITLQIDTVGFAVDDKARRQLQCIADKGRGTYYDAADADQLGKSLQRLSTRAIRQYAVSGVPVEGTPAPEGAPSLSPGQYTDNVSSSLTSNSARYYRVHRTQQGSTLRVSVTGRMRYAGIWDSIRRGRWDFTLTAADGTKCDSVWYLSGDSAKMGDFPTGTVVALPVDPRSPQPAPEAVACGKASDLLLEVTRQAGVNETIPVEILVIEEPAVSNAAELPDGVAQVPKDNPKDLTSPASGTPVLVIGGVSFNDATLVDPGTYVTEVVPGERLFFRAPIDWGQGAVFAVDGPTGNIPVTVSPNLAYLYVEGNVYAPDRSQMDSQELWKFAAYRMTDAGFELGGAPDINQVPDVRFRNRWDSPRMYFGSSRGFSMSGDYYFTVAVGRDSDVPDGFPVPVRFSLAVTGERGGVPDFVQPGTPSPTPSETSGASGSQTPSLEPTATTSTAPSPERSGGGPFPLVLVGGGLIAAGAVGTGAALYARRRH